MPWFLILFSTAVNYSLFLRALVVSVNCPVRRCFSGWHPDVSAGEEGKAEHLETEERTGKMSTLAGCS